MKSSSEVSDQPVSLDEVIMGAINGRRILLINAITEMLLQRRTRIWTNEITSHKYWIYEHMIYEHMCCGDL